MSRVHSASCILPWLPVVGNEGGSPGGGAGCCSLPPALLLLLPRDAGQGEFCLLHIPAEGGHSRAAGTSRQQVLHPWCSQTGSAGSQSIPGHPNPPPLAAPGVLFCSLCTELLRQNPLLRAQQFWAFLLEAQH